MGTAEHESLVQLRLDRIVPCELVGRDISACVFVRTMQVLLPYVTWVQHEEEGATHCSDLKAHHQSVGAVYPWKGRATIARLYQNANFLLAMVEGKKGCIFLVIDIVPEVYI